MLWVGYHGECREVPSGSLPAPWALSFHEHGCRLLVPHGCCGRLVPTICPAGQYTLADRAEGTPALEASLLTCLQDIFIFLCSFHSVQGHITVATHVSEPEDILPAPPLPTMTHLCKDFFKTLL